ncbi:hypothetical protein BS50DRAFT_573013 [Corynespora cassiicola Philippines]|uniref:Uncharacterized protein n=1 Tax=Corynespora cassiicola Philippines TaxID=1448308 RepID=A0A2T2NSI3_CORCC|nr:hypothetical protein BS50DRAFT_573013 [Corynespora cassiicola Philippines]
MPTVPTVPAPTRSQNMTAAPATPTSTSPGAGASPLLLKRNEYLHIPSAALPGARPLPLPLPPLCLLALLL